MKILKLLNKKSCLILIFFTFFRPAGKLISGKWKKEQNTKNRWFFMVSEYHFGDFSEILEINYGKRKKKLEL